MQNKSITKSNLPKEYQEYKYWLYHNRLTLKIEQDKKLINGFSYNPKFSIIMPVYNVEDYYLKEAINSLFNQTYTNWELCIADDGSTKSHIKPLLEYYASKDKRIKLKFLKNNIGISGASNEALSNCTGEFVGFLDNDDVLYPDALVEVCNVLNKNPKVDLIYSDEDKIDQKYGRIEPYFKPDWSPDLLLSFGYINHFTVIRKSLIEKIGGFRAGFDGSQDYDLLLRTTELTKTIAHIPRPLYGWRKIHGSTAESILAKNHDPHLISKKSLEDALDRRKIKGKVIMLQPGLFRIKYEIIGSPLVSIIIITHDQPKLLKNLIKSIEEITSYQNYEIIIVDRKSEKKETLNFLKTISHKVIRYEGDRNLSKVINFISKQITGEHFLFMNDDMQVINSDWLTALLEYSQKPEVGVVGNLLLYPKNKKQLADLIQHAGMVLGSKSAAGHVFYHRDPSLDTYHNLHRVVRNVSAVTGACIMVKRKIFEEMGGWDENLPITFNDIDFCLRVNQKGYTIIYTPFSKVYHLEGATRGNFEIEDDERFFINKWKDELIKGDPYYNQNLSLVKEDYTISFYPNQNPALSSLMEVFYIRTDLQKIFPEADQGNYKNLISWAFTSGVKEYPSLRPYSDYYLENSKLIK